MSITIPNTFATRTADLQLSELDDNFAYIASELDNSISQIDTTNSNVNNLLSSIQVSPGNTVITGSITINGQTNLQQISETLNTKTGATGTVTHDFSTGAVWFHNSVTSNFTANFTNVPTTDDRVLSVAITINQGDTGYYPSAVQINGVAQTIRWQANTLPTPGVNRVDVYTYNLMRTSNTWYVLGAATSH